MTKIERMLADMRMSSRRGNRRVAPLYRLDIFKFGTGASDAPKLLRTHISADKDKLKAKRRKLQDRFDIHGPFQISRRDHRRLTALSIRLAEHSVRTKQQNKIEARRLKLQKLERGIK